MKRSDTDTDVCIIGSGASGAIMAKELAVAGIRVVIVEKGDWLVRDELAEDELIWKTRLSYQPDDERAPTWFAEEPNGEFRRAPIGPAFYLVGGGTVIYAAASWRLRESDFRKKTQYGSIAGTTLADWPIQYSDLEPYYTQAEKELGISGVAGEDPTEPKRSRNVLDPPIDLDAFSEMLMAAGSRVGLKPFHMPMAIRSLDDPEAGTQACQKSGWCSGYPCQFGSKSSVDLRILPKALATGRCQLLTGAAALRIEIDSHGLCREVLCQDVRSRQPFVVRAKIVILAASAIQTARLLLFSTSKLFPDGLANANGLLGQNLMFHITQKQKGQFSREFPFRLNKLVSFNDYYYPETHGDPWVNACSIQAGSRWGPLKFAQQTPGWGRSYVDSLIDEYPRTQLLQAFAEDLPQSRNRVVLHPDDKDAFGVPRAKVIHKYHPDDRRALAKTLTRACEILKAAGATKTPDEEVPTNVMGDYTYHLMGTCRFGVSEKDSVLNPYCQAHSVKNLFVIDGSFFPTSAGLNPTLTYQANSYRVADHIISRVRRGDWARL